MTKHWWSMRPGPERQSLKAAANPRDDDIAQRRYRETKRKRIERMRQKGATDRLLLLAEKIQQQFEARQRETT